MDNYIFYMSLLLSLLVHSLALGYFSFTRIKEVKKYFRPIEVVYQPENKKRAHLPDEEKRKPPKIEDEKEQSKEIKMIAKKDGLLPFMEQQNIKDISKMTRNFALDKKESPRISPLESSKKISIPMFSSEKITNPSYLGYQDKIKLSIQKQAYRYVDHPEFASAEVSLAFVVTSDGKLKEVKLLPERTKGSQFMQNLAVRCIKEVGFFGKFPADSEFNLPELPYNITIVFQVK
ncbi:MAG: hypothetical protein HQL27_09255 [Candidatus Omnitrophica bacterium]|nr:hypothetical protein [Candidatus Omnitrophota bacterium]